MKLRAKQSERDLWDPFEFASELHNEMKSLFRKVAHHQETLKAKEPPVDVYEDPDVFLIRSDIPGMKRQDIEIKVDGRTLSLKGERKQDREGKERVCVASERFHGIFSRVIDLPTDIHSEKVWATYHDGILEITLPKNGGSRTKEFRVEVR